MNRTLEWHDLQITLNDRGTYRTSLDETPPSEAIVGAVLAIEDADSTDLEPLYDIIDPAALDELFRAKFNGSGRSAGSVSFEYAGYEIVYDANGDLELRPLPNDENRDTDEAESPTSRYN
jgi:hypothetical protein